MSDDPGDLAKSLDKIGFPKDLTQAVDTVDAFVTAISPIFAGFSAGKSVLQALHLLPQEVSLDDIKNELDAIQQKLQILGQLDNESLGLSQQLTRDTVWTATANIRGLRDDALSYCATPDPQHYALLQAALAQIRGAVNALQPPGYWTQVYSPRVYYSDVWIGSALPPAPPEGFLGFDYRLQLPAYIEAVTNLIVVFMAGGPEFLSDLTTELQNHLTSLVTVYDQILTGFMELSAPNKIDLVYAVEAQTPKAFWYWGDSGNLPTDPTNLDTPILPWSISDNPNFCLSTKIPGGNWVLAGTLCGVADRWGGLYSVDLSYDGFVNPISINLELGNAWDFASSGDPYDNVLATRLWSVDENQYDVGYKRFIAHMRISGIRHGNNLYWNKTGLGAARQIIMKISNMLNLPPPEIPADFKKYTQLALSDIFRAAKEVGLLDPGSRSFRSLEAALGWSGASLRTLFWTPNLV